MKTCDNEPSLKSFPQASKALASALALGLLATPCNELLAASITNTKSFDLQGSASGEGQTAYFNTSMSFDLFDPALGTLNQVNITISTTTYASSLLSVNRFDGNPYEEFGGDAWNDAWFTMLLSQDASMITSGMTTIFLPAYGILDENGFGFAVSGDTRSAPINETLSYAGPAAIFSGTGTFDLLCEQSIHIGLIGGYNYSFAGTSMDAEWQGGATVEYVYTPVPEPGVPLLLIGGLAAMVVRRRRSAGFR